jgi:DAPG hydrolase PhiG domain
MEEHPMRMTRWTIAPPLALPWAPKLLNSAQTRMTRLRNGQLELTIKHDLIRGVTREMLAWWFCRIDGMMNYHGHVLPRYRVWHPRDHIFYADLTLGPDQTGSVGTRRRIVEAFGRNPKYLVNIVDRVVKLDETGILLSTEQAGITLGTLQTPLLPLGAEVSTLQHDFIAAPGGTRYESRMLVGRDTLFGRLFLNRYALPWLVLPDDMAQAWLTHNVEEVGNFERFLPQWYDHWLDVGDPLVSQADRASQTAVQQ